LIFVISQFILKLIIEPIVNFKETLGEISNVFLSNQNKIVNANADKSIQNEIKLCSAKLLSKRQTIPFYKYAIIQKIFGLPSNEKLFEGIGALNLLNHAAMKEYPTNANEDIYKKIFDAMKQVEDNLKIKVTFSSL